MNAESLTAQRTGAVAAVGAKYTAPPDVHSLGVVGCGTQGAWAAIAICALRQIRTVHCLPRSATSFERFRTALAEHAPGVALQTHATAAAMLERVSLVVAATTSAVPVLPDEPLRLAGKHFIGIGSFRPDMQELPDSVYRLSRQVVVDSPAAQHEAGDVAGPLQRGVLRVADLLPLDALVTGRARIAAGATTVFKSVGMAAFDLFAADALYRAALTARVGRSVDLR